MIFKLIYFQKN